jgi:hypothetical protein
MAKDSAIRVDLPVMEVPSPSVAQEEVGIVAAIRVRPAVALGNNAVVGSARVAPQAVYALAQAACALMGTPTVVALAQPAPRAARAPELPVSVPQDKPTAVACV